LQFSSIPENTRTFEPILINVSNTAGLNIVVDAGGENYASPNSTIRLCFSKGIPASENPSTWDGEGCQSQGVENFFFESNDVNFTTPEIFPRAGLWFVNIALHDLGISNNSTLTNVDVFVSIPNDCDDGSVFWEGKCQPYETHLPDEEFKVGDAGDHLIVFNISSVIGVDEKNYANFFSASFSQPVDHVVMRLNGVPTNGLHDKSCNQVCLYSFPEKGLLFISWTQKTLNRNLTVLGTLHFCEPKGNPVNPDYYMGISCDEPIFFHLKDNNVGNVRKFHSPLKTTLFYVDTIASREYYRFGVAGLEDAGEASIYASYAGFPSAYVGEMISNFDLNNGTIKIDLPNNFTAQRWFVRFDFKNEVKSFLWWTEYDCPGFCDHNGDCDSDTGVCSCKKRSADEILCTYVPVISSQWIIVTVIVSVIFVAVLVAYLVRCCRERRIKGLIGEKPMYAEI